VHSQQAQDLAKGMNSVLDRQKKKEKVRLAASINEEPGIILGCPECGQAHLLVGLQLKGCKVSDRHTPPQTRALRASEQRCG